MEFLFASDFGYFFYSVFIISREKGFLRMNLRGVMIIRHFVSKERCSWEKFFVEFHDFRSEKQKSVRKWEGNGEVKFFFLEFYLYLYRYWLILVCIYLFMFNAFVCLNYFFFFNNLITILLFIYFIRLKLLNIWKYISEILRIWKYTDIKYRFNVKSLKIYKNIYLYSTRITKKTKI